MSTTIPCTPIPPQCQWGSPRLCAHAATHWLIQDDGQPNPGGWYCQEHGERLVREMLDVSGEAWSLAPLNMGVRCQSCGLLFTDGRYAEACCTGIDPTTGEAT